MKWIYVETPLATNQFLLRHIATQFEIQHIYVLRIKKKLYGDEARTRPGICRRKKKTSTKIF